MLLHLLVEFNYDWVDIFICLCYNSKWIKDEFPPVVVGQIVFKFYKFK